MLTRMEGIDFDGEEVLADSKGGNDVMFDCIVGYIEDIIIDDHFQTLQNSFLDRYFIEFDDSEENKLVYMDIFKAYNAVIERYIEEQLLQRIPSFVMSDFVSQLVARKNELEGEVFEMLLTFSDFMAFKELILDYKHAKEGNAVDLSPGLTVTPVNRSSR